MHVYIKKKKNPKYWSSLNHFFASRRPNQVLKESQERETYTINIRDDQCMLLSLILCDNYAAHKI